MTGFQAHNGKLTELRR